MRSRRSSASPPRRRSRRSTKPGFPGFYVSIWQGVWAPKGTPKEIIAKLNAAIAGALADPTVQKRLAEIGQEMPSAEQMTPERLRRVPQGRDGKVDADHQGGEHQAGRLRAMLEKTQRTTAGAADRAPLIVRRIDAIPVALPLKAPMKMAGVTITKAENLLVRVEVGRRHGRLGRGAIGADHDRRHARRTCGGGARSPRAAAHRQGCRPARPPADAARARLSATPARIRPSRWRCSTWRAVRRTGG